MFFLRYITLKYSVEARVTMMIKKLYVLILCLICSFSIYSEPLPAHQAFGMTIKTEGNNLILQWKIMPKHFLYKDRLQITTMSNSNVKLGEFKLPPTFSNAASNNYEAWQGNLRLVIPVSGLLPGEELVTVAFQGCAASGYCYPPTEEQIRLTFDQNLQLVSASQDQQVDLVVDDERDTEATVNKLFAHHWALTLLIYLGLGLLLAMTPCVLPMVPVLSGIIIGHGKKISTRRAFMLSLAYVLGMAVTYAIIGAVIARMGQNLQIIMQNPWVIFAFAVVFVLLALSMFDIYNLQLPRALQTKIAHASRDNRGHSWFKAAIMGSLSILILSPCVSAPLLGVLGFIAQSGQIWYGMLALFCLALGMGLPLLVVGGAFGHLLPKAGMWMESIKHFFGILMLAVALWLFARILPGNIIMLLTAALLIFSAIYAGIFNKAETNFTKFKKGLGIIALTWGVLVLLGAAVGNTNPFLPLQTRTVLRHEIATRVTTLTEAQKIVTEQGRRPLMIEFYADWCISCRKLESSVLQELSVIALLNDFRVIKVDLSANNAESRALLDYFHVVAPPAFLFYTADGNELQNLRKYGEITTRDLCAVLMQVLAAN